MFDKIDDKDLYATDDKFHIKHKNIYNLEKKSSKKINKKPIYKEEERN